MLINGPRDPKIGRTNLRPIYTYQAKANETAKFSLVIATAQYRLHIEFVHENENELETDISIRFQRKVKLSVTMFWGIRGGSGYHVTGGTSHWEPLRNVYHWENNTINFLEL